MDNNELQIEIERLKQEIQNLKGLIYKNTYSNLEVFNKQVLFKGYVGFYGTAPIAQQTATGATTVAEIVTILNNLGLTK